jgi:hypothetical protein
MSAQRRSSEFGSCRGGARPTCRCDTTDRSECVRLDRPRRNRIGPAAPNFVPPRERSWRSAITRAHSHLTKVSAAAAAGNKQGDTPARLPRPGCHRRGQHHDLHRRALPPDRPPPRRRQNPGRRHPLDALRPTSKKLGMIVRLRGGRGRKSVVGQRCKLFSNRTSRTRLRRWHTSRYGPRRGEAINQSLHSVSDCLTCQQLTAGGHCQDRARRARAQTSTQRRTGHDQHTDQSLR